MEHNFASSLAGYLSIACWLIVFTPQLLENYNRKSGDGLSMTFLVIWLAGDIFNLLGVIMQDLLVTMFFLALYYTVADMALIWQVIYYQQCQKIRQENIPSETTSLLNNYRLTTNYISDNTTSKPTKLTKLMLFNYISAISIILVTMISSYTYFNIHKPYHHKAVNEDDSDVLLFLPQLMGWTSAILYVGSRIPQILKNWKNKSTEGLSFGMFFCAVMGNILFTMSIFLKSTNKNYLLVNLSWIIGSCGTLVFDFIIFIQFFLYNENKAGGKIVVV